VGKNSEKVLNPYFSIVITFIPIKTENDKVNVTKRWLVDVNEYGINPIILLNKIKLKISEMNGKYFVLSVVIMSEINWATISEIDSITFCHEFDI
jgi:putative ribosome biogenesis GTPase RsgA